MPRSRRWRQRLPVRDAAACAAADGAQRAIPLHVRHGVLGMAFDIDAAELEVDPRAPYSPAQRAVASRRDGRRRRQAQTDSAAVAGTLMHREGECGGDSSCISRRKQASVSVGLRQGLRPVCPDRIATSERAASAAAARTLNLVGPRSVPYSLSRPTAFRQPPGERTTDGNEAQALPCHRRRRCNGLAKRIACAVPQCRTNRRPHGL